ncbi:MAG: head protein [Hungatella sp.]|nr:head protein [Dorea sp.]MCI9636216.1 head protein [Hungatella sp.]
MIINAGNLRALNTSYSTAYNKGFNSVEPTYQRIASRIPSTSKIQEYNWLGQFPQLREWIGDREIQNLSAYKYQIENLHFEMTVGVDRDEIEDDQYGIYTLNMENMGVQARKHPDKLVYKLLMGGFANLCYDGKPFFSEEHKCGGAIYSNVTNEKLCADSYMKARTAMMGLCGDKGDSLNLVPDLLVVSPAYEMEARKILKADQIDGSTNVLKDTADLLVSTELAANKDYWFLMDTKQFLKPLIFQERKPYKFVNLNRETDQNVFMQNKFLYGADGRCNAGYGFWQMAYGSTGTADVKG